MSNSLEQFSLSPWASIKTVFFSMRTAEKPKVEEPRESEEADVFSFNGAKKRGFFLFLLWLFWVFVLGKKRGIPHF